MQVISLATFAACALPAVQAHMSIFHPSGYSFDKGDSAVWPLANKPFSEWWFHGNIGSKPKETLTLVPGQDTILEIACSKAWTSYGDKSSQDACPNDAGSYHAGGQTGSQSGWNGNDESNLAGCALAIAFKSNPYDVKPEDFTIMSVQERCVRQRDTSFSIPSNLPSCPDGGCTCSWFWGGKNSATEMYMSAFKCDVQGGSGTNYPRATEPRKGKVDGPTQPYYFANDLNNLGFEADWGSKPSYNGAWGWKNGAQEGAFSGLNADSGNGENNGGDGGGSNSTSSAAEWQSTSERPISTSTRRRRPTTTTTANGNDDWQNLAAAPTSTTTGRGGHSCKRRLRRHV